MAVDALLRRSDEPATDLRVEVSCASGQAKEGLVDSLPESIVRGVHEVLIAWAFFCTENAAAELTISRGAKRSRSFSNRFNQEKRLREASACFRTNHALGRGPVRRQEEKCTSIVCGSEGRADQAPDRNERGPRSQPQALLQHSATSSRVPLSCS